MPTIAKEIEVDIYQKTYQHPILGDILERDNYIGADISGKPNHQDHDYLISQLNLCKYSYLLTYDTLMIVKQLSQILVTINLIKICELSLLNYVEMIDNIRKNIRLFVPKIKKISYE